MHRPSPNSLALKTESITKPITYIALTFPDLTFSSSAHVLDVTLDRFADHISLLTRSCYHQLRRN